MPLAVLKRGIAEFFSPEREANGLAFFVFRRGGRDMPVRGVRGATVADEDQPEAILSATRELLHAILEANPEMRVADVASALFTLSEDLSSAYPARAARQMGWHQVPLMCAREIPIPGGLPRCIRLLIHWNTDLPQSAIHHVYLGAAAKLRPDLNVAENHYPGGDMP
jgi:chorismate mutase